MLKRLLDFAVAATLLLLLWPLLLVVALLIRWKMGPPALFRQQRPGLGGAPFILLKFRTMRDANGADGQPLPDAERLTPLGQFIRRSSLDELPQLLNVLRGDMSLVGPRPQVKWAVDGYTADERRLLTVRPGITDWASLRFSNEGELLKGSSDPDRDYMLKIHPEKVALGLKYVDGVSFATDIRILLRTAASVLGVRSSQ